MAKEDIIGGLLLAVKKGESLEQAMLSFFNAGYKREEIENAARELQTLPDYPIQTQQTQQPKVSLKPQPQLKRLPKTSQIKSIKQLKPLTSNKSLQEPSSKKPLSLSQPTPKLNENLNQPPVPYSQITDQDQPMLEPLTEVEITPKNSFSHTFPQPPQPNQNMNSLASNYGGSGPNPKSMMVWFLSILLLTLVLVLGGVFFFRNTLIEFFNNLV